MSTQVILNLPDDTYERAARYAAYAQRDVAEIKALTSNLGDEDSVSGRINRAAERYLEILKRHGLDLTEDERFILGKCLSGYWVEPLLIRHLADAVEDSELAKSETGRALIEKLQSARFADLIAEVERLGF